MMMQLWPTQSLERHVAMLQDAIKKGVSDQDTDARSLARKYVDTTCFLLSMNYFEDTSLAVMYQKYCNIAAYKP